MGVIKQYLINGASPVTVGGTGTTIKYFSDAPGANAWNSGATGVNTGISGNQTQGQTPSSTTNAGGLQAPGNNELNGQFFHIRASGNLAVGAGVVSSNGVKVGIYLSKVAPGVSPAYSTLIESAALEVALDNVYYPWTLNVIAEGDSQSGLLQFYKTAWSMVDGTAFTAAAGTPISGINFAANPPFVLVCGVTFGDSGAGNTANLFQFQIDLP